MRKDSPDKRKGKRLLVASIGVATVSYLALQSGCTDEETITSVANLLAPPLDASVDGNLPPPADASSDALITSGNLLPPPADASSDALITSGNLLPPPADASSDALITSGNLLPPPPPEAGTDTKDAAAASDARADVGLPTVGNLLPPPKPPILPPPPRRAESD